ncbi:MAG: tetratricopeptide repeat protein [Candidatus Alcyoniella australis]|nr:tetratricopeptide repeat protein [Candidatus Alcyoniella australis]
MPPQPVERTDSARITVAALIACVAGFGLALFKITSYDVWWHLALGRRIAVQGIIGGPDPFSYTFSERIYPHSDWLFDLLLYLCHSALGVAGLPMVKALLFGLLAAAIVLWSVRRGLSAGTALWVALLCLTLMRYRLFLRPHLASILLFAALLWLLEASRARPRLLLGLPPLLLLWSNLHDGVIFGLILGGLYLAAALLRPVLKSGADTHNPWKLGAALILGLGLTLVNPAPGSYLVHALSSAAPNVGPFPESGPLVARGHYLLLFAMALSTALLSWRLSRQSLLPLLLLLPFAALSIKHGRLGPYFALVLPVAFVSLLSAGDFPNNRRARHALWALGWTALIVLGGLDICAGRALFPRGTGIAQRRVPVAATRFVFDQLPLDGLRLYNSYEFGGYLDWELPQNAKVFWDGRTRFNLDFVYQALSEDPAQLFSRLRPDAALVALPRGQRGSWFALDEYFLDNPQWTPVFFDDTAIVLAPSDGPLARRLGYRALQPHVNGLEYLALALRNPGVLELVRSEIDRAVSGSEDNSVAVLLAARLLRIEQRPDAALELAEQQARDNPDFYEVQNLLATMLFERGEHRRALEHFRRAVRLAPESAAARNNLGVALQGLGRVDAARRAFEQALKIDPQNPDALYNLARINQP